MNYPDGMTKQDWQHIDGQEHFKVCPMHEDYEHDCWNEARLKKPKWAEAIIPEQAFPHAPEWSMVIRPSMMSRSLLPILFCPYCGEEPERPDCICDRLSEQLREEDHLRKGEDTTI